jgi:uncharacterized protein YecA (UPF0149 family)
MQSHERIAADIANLPHFAEPARYVDWILQRMSNRLGEPPTDMCPCGSGKKFKRCCYKRKEPTT